MARFPLRYAIPVLILLAGMLIVATAWFMESRAITRSLTDVAERQLRSNASFIAAELEGAFRAQDTSEARAAVERASANPAIDALYVVTPDRLVRHASETRAIGDPLHSAPGVGSWLDALPFEDAGGSIAIHQPSMPGMLVGRFPLQMRAGPSELMPLRFGALYIVYDVSEQLAAQQAALGTRMAEWVGIIVLIAIAFWALLRALLLKRIDTLVHVVRAVGRGDFSESSREQGRDEIGELGREIDSMISSLRDQSERLAFLSDHDSLTGLLNRHGFEEAVERALKDVRRRDGRYALYLLDIDSLRVINDTQGHLAGDELLRSFADLLREALPESEAQARVGGDEFAVLLDVSTTNSMQDAAERLQKRIRAFRFERRGERFGIQVSTGVVPLDSRIRNAEEALGYADAACYRAKETQRGGVHVGSLDSLEIEREKDGMRWVSRIQEALDEDRFRLFAQLIEPIATPDGHGLHFEILVRMVDRDGTLLPPGEFLAAAEKYNLVGRVDRWVVRKTLTRIHDDVRLRSILSSCSINLSGLSMGDADLLGEISEWLAEHDHVDPSALCFEVTETAAIRNLEQARDFVDRLRAMGCRFALDDFGTGLSSFAYIKRLPVDIVKIDGMFVRDICADRTDRAIVKAIRDIAHHVGMQTIAEFVEHDGILEELAKIGVDFGQGYGISRPAPLDEVIESWEPRLRKSG